MKQISLVTGGAGFIGSHTAKYLLKLNHKVVVLDDLSGGFKENIPEKAIFVKGSILDIKLLDQIFKEYKFDYVYHLAAYAAEGLSHFIRKFNYENNLVGSINLINKAIVYKIKHFVFTSSIAVYGENQVPMTESMIPQPKDPYGIAKYAVEMDLKAANNMFGLTYTVFRPHNVYGERQNLCDPYRNVIGIFIRDTLLNKPMTIFGDGKQLRAFSYIEDVAPYIAKCIDVPGARNEVFNIGADRPYRIIDLANIIAKEMGVKPQIKYLPKREEVTHAFSDHKKIRRVFSIKKTVDLKEGIKRTIRWTKTYNLPNPKKFKKIEIKKKLPAAWTD